MPTPTAAERLHAQQQKNRKAAGLPDPSEYKKKLDSMKSEEVEQLDEISDKLKASYVSGAKKQIKQSMPFTKKSDEYRDIAKNFIAKRQKGIAKANESVTVGGTGGRGNIHMYDRNPPAKDGSELENVPFHAKTEKQKKLQNALNDLGKKMRETHPKLKEDYEDPITIIKKGTNVKKKISADAYDVFKHHGFRKEAKDAQEYDYEGDMAKSDLRSILHHAKELHDMIEDNTNLAEWCQSKITLSEDYLSTVANYMRSEMNEEVKKNEYHIAGKHKFPTKDEHAVTVKHTESGREHVHSGKGKYLSKLIKSRYNINHHFEDVEYQDNEQLDEYESKGGTYTHKGSYGRQKTGPDSSKYTKPHTAGGSELKNSETTSLEKGMGVTWGRKSLGKAQSKETLMNVHKNLPEDVEQMDEKKNLPGLWANIRAKRARGESPAKPGDKDYPKTLNIESTDDVPFSKPYKKDSGTTTDKSGAKHTPMSKARHLARQAMSKTTDKPVKESAADPSEGEMKDKQGYSRKAQIVKDAARGKKSDNADKFQKDPELSSEIHKT